MSSSPFRAIELREHRASSAPSLRKLDGASAGKLYSFVLAFTCPSLLPRGARGFPFLSTAVAVIRLHRLGLKGTITSSSIGGQMYARHERKREKERITQGIVIVKKTRLENSSVGSSRLRALFFTLVGQMVGIFKTLEFL